MNHRKGGSLRLQHSRKTGYIQLCELDPDPPAAFRKKGQNMKELSNQLQDLKKARRWVCWKRVTRDGKTTKPPFNPRTGYGAKTNDPDTWGTYEEAKAAHERGDYDGIGFVFTDTEFFGIDLDHVLNEGKISAAAEDVLKTVESYTEKSPSGDGLHILCRGRAPEGARKAKRGEGNDFEIYDRTSPRYFTVTGDVFRDLPIAEKTAEAAAIHRKYWPQEQPKQETPQKASERPQERDPFAEYDILHKMFESAHGDEIRRLWEGDTSANGGDHSAADLSLCAHLIYWTDGDAGLADRLFRRSGLMREKWDRRMSSRSDRTYGQQTIEKALSGWTPRAQAPQQTQRTQGTEGTQQPQKKEAAPDLGRFIPHNVEAYLKEKTFEKDIEYFRQYKDRKTGFVQIDKHLTLYPGLAVLGGVASLGKTTFCTQLADQLIRKGETVLYFSMEQQPIELVTKGLTRTLCEVDPATQLTNIEVKNGATSASLDKAKALYAERSKEFYIVNCDFNTTVEQIREYVIQFMKDHSGKKPVLFIDYLQLIAPPEELRGKSDKEIVDHVAKALKMLQQEKELLIICISNFNRSNYIVPVSESSFKESGMIEYCADYLWGLQFSLLSDPMAFKRVGTKGGITEFTIIDKIHAVEEEKNKNPKEIEFVSIKSRNGKQSYGAYFQYYVERDYFREYPESTYNKGRGYYPELNTPERDFDPFSQLEEDLEEF